MMREFVKTLLLAVACIATFIWLLSILTACPRPTPGPGEPQASAPMRCGTEAIESCASSALPGIYACLDGAGDATACLLGLVRPVGCALYETIACLVRGEGARAEHLAQAERSGPAMGALGPAGSVNWQRAARAKEFLERTGAKFEGGGGP
jgi:hypothetical protein